MSQQRATETCSCGASFTIEAYTVSGFLTEFRAQHRHTLPPPPTEAEFYRSVDDEDHELHEHQFEEAKLIHTHRDGNVEHDYFEHDEDADGNPIGLKEVTQ